MSERGYCGAFALEPPFEMRTNDPFALARERSVLPEGGPLPNYHYPVYTQPSLTTTKDNNSNNNDDKTNNNNGNNYYYNTYNN